MEIEVEADSLSEAKEKVRAQIPPGYSLVSEKVVSDGLPRTAKGQGETEAKAFEQAQGQIPGNARIVDRKVVSGFSTRTVAIAAFDLEQAQAQAKTLASNVETLGTPRLVASGTKGFLGIGRKPHQYEIELTSQAVAEISYKIPVKIAAKAASRLEALLAEFWSTKTQTARDTYEFIRDHHQDEIAQVCSNVPIGFDRLERFDRVLAFASILTGYPEALKTYSNFGLPRDLDHRHLAGILMSRLTAFIETVPDWMGSMRLQDQKNPLPDLVKQRVITERLYDFAMKLLVNDYPREALTCLKVHQLQPVKTDADFWIFGALCNIVANEGDRAAAREGIRVGKELMTSNTPSDAKRSVAARLEYLESSYPPGE